MVRWLQLCASKAGGVGSIPGRGIKIPYNCTVLQKKIFFLIKKKKKEDKEARWTRSGTSSLGWRLKQKRDQDNVMMRPLHLS